MPVIASHAGYRFGKESYMLDAPTIERIARRDGVIGVILAQHQLNDGLRTRETRTLAESLEVVRRHVDRIAEITGSDLHAALGTDLDGSSSPPRAASRRPPTSPRSTRGCRTPTRRTPS